jgi:hypothetical protein
MRKKNRYVQGKSKGKNTLKELSTQQQQQLKSCLTAYQKYRVSHYLPNPALLSNSDTNDDIATRFEQEYVRCVRNEEECVCSTPNCYDTEQRSAS